MEVKTKGINEVNETLKAMPALFARAKTSALKGVGYEVRKKLQQYIKSAGTFKALHPLREKFHKTKSSGMWKPRTTGPRPLTWLARYAQYYMVNEDEVHVSLRDATKGQLKGDTPVDRSIIKMLEKHEQGETLFLSEKMKEDLNVGLKKAGLKLLKEETKKVDIPPRPIMAPLFAQVRSEIPKMFEKKFMTKLKKYIKEGPQAAKTDQQEPGK